MIILNSMNLDGALYQAHGLEANDIPNVYITIGYLDTEPTYFIHCDKPGME